MPMLTMFLMRLPVKPFHSPRADAVGEGGHRVEHLVHLGHDIHAVDDDLLALGRAQGDVQHGAAFGDVDLVAAEHGVDLGAEAGLLGELDEQLEGLVGDAVLRVIEVEALGLEGEALAAGGVVGEELAQGQLLHLRVVRFQGFEGGQCAQWRQGVLGIRHHDSSSI